MISLAGALEGIGLPALVRFLAGLQPSGRLFVADDVWGGEVGFERGAVVAATFGAERGLAAFEAIALALPHGEFRFTGGPSNGSGPAGRDDDLPLADLDGYLNALAETQGAIARVLPTLAAVPRLLRPEGPAGPGRREGRGGAGGTDQLTIDRSTLFTLLLIDGRRTVYALCEARAGPGDGAQSSSGGQGVAQTLKELTWLVGSGLVAVEPPTQPDGDGTTDGGRPPRDGGVPARDGGRPPRDGGGPAGPAGPAPRDGGRVVDRRDEGGDRPVRPPSPSASLSAAPPGKPEVPRATGGPAVQDRSTETASSAATADAPAEGKDEGKSADEGKGAGGGKGESKGESKGERLARLVPLARLRSWRFMATGASTLAAGPAGPAGPAGSAGLAEASGANGADGAARAVEGARAVGDAGEAEVAGNGEEVDEPPLRYWRRTMILAVLALMLLAVSWMQQNGLPSGGLMGRPVPVNGSAVTTSSQP